MPKFVVLAVRGMTCTSCAKTVETVLLGMEGVEGVSVDFANGRAKIELSDTLDLNEASKRVREMGYVLVYDEVKLKLIGGGESDSKRVAEEIMKLPGVVATYAVGDNVIVQFSPIQTELRTILSSAKKFGFQVEVEGKKEDKKSISLLSRFFLSLPATLAVAAGHHFSVPPFNNFLLQAILSAYVVLLCGWPIVRSGIFALRVLSPNMNTLIALGALVSLLSGYFEASAFIISYILLGKSLEERARKKAYEELGGLVDVIPSVCRVERDGKVVEISTDEVNEGDVVVVAAGEKVPVDGTVSEGKGELSLALLTGESSPVAVSVGDKVLAGSVLTDGFIKVEVESLGGDTFIGGVRRMVLEAQGRKGEIQRLADKISAYFIYAVGLIALLTLGIWMLTGHPLSQALMYSVAVMVVACPCPLGIATPLVFAVATSLAGKRGILLKGSDVIERGRGIKFVVFDKTGTLTYGHPEVVKYEGPEELLRYAYSLAYRSQHPYSRAIVKFAKGRRLRVSDFKVIVGKGLEGVIEGKVVRLGKADFVGGDGGDVLVSADGMGIGRFVIEDPIRPEAKEVVRELRNMGKRAFIVSGDSKENVEKVAREVEADGYVAGILPEGKVEYVKKLKREGKVMFVGDGVNDAPVLAEADVGVAMGSATDMATLAGDAVLLRNDLKGIPFFVKLLEESYVKVVQNLTWAFLYNSTLIPVAAFGKMAPQWAALIMSMSSLTVIFNALSLKLRVKSSVS